MITGAGPVNYYQRHIGDYTKDVRFITMLEDGAYARLMDWCYAHEKPLPADTRTVCEKVGAHSVAERRAVVKILEEHFFLLEDGWHHKRIDSELAKYTAKSEKARASANARWEAERAAADAEADAEAMRSHSVGNANQEPIANSQSLNTATLRVAPAHPSDDRQPGLEGMPPPKPSKAPDCPHLSILALWQEKLPAMPQHDPERWRGAKADHLRTRWRETAEAKKWPDAAAGLLYFRRLFGYVGQSAFLTGRGATMGGKRPFMIELEWLVTPANWDKVHEGKYHPEKEIRGEAANQV